MCPFVQTLYLLSMVLFPSLRLSLRTDIFYIFHFMFVIYLLTFYPGSLRVFILFLISSLFTLPFSILFYIVSRTLERSMINPQGLSFLSFTSPL